MHPLLALVIAMLVAALIVGIVQAILSLRDVPEGYEDDHGFWRGDESAAKPVPIRVRREIDERLGDE